MALVGVGDDAVRAVDARVVCLPPYSPGFNPCRAVFSKIKNELRRRELRSIAALRPLPFCTSSTLARYQRAKRYRPGRINSNKPATMPRPTTTSAARLLDGVLPDLAGRIVAQAVRVPVASVSCVDFHVMTERRPGIEEVNAAFREYWGSRSRNLSADSIVRLLWLITMKVMP